MVGSSVLDGLIWKSSLPALPVQHNATTKRSKPDSTPISEAVLDVSGHDQPVSLSRYPGTSDLMHNERHRLRCAPSSDVHVHRAVACWEFRTYKFTMSKFRRRAYFRAIASKLLTEADSPEDRVVQWIPGVERAYNRSRIVQWVCESGVLALAGPASVGLDKKGNVRSLTVRVSEDFENKADEYALHTWDPNLGEMCIVWFKRCSKDVDSFMDALDDQLTGRAKVRRVSANGAANKANSKAVSARKRPRPANAAAPVARMHTPQHQPAHQPPNRHAAEAPGVDCDLEGELEQALLEQQCAEAFMSSEDVQSAISSFGVSDIARTLVLDSTLSHNTAKKVDDMDLVAAPAFVNSVWVIVMIDLKKQRIRLGGTGCSERDRMHASLGVVDWVKRMFLSEHGKSVQVDKWPCKCV